MRHPAALEEPQAAKSCKIVPQPSKSALLAIDGTFTNDGGAVMGKSQIIHTDGEDLVVITLSDYERLCVHAPATRRARTR